LQEVDPVAPVRDTSAQSQTAADLAAMTDEYRTVAMAADVANNASVCVELDGLDLLICNADGTFHAVENRCSHQDKPLTGGRIRSGYVSCPLHGMRYKLETGDPMGQLSRVPIRVFPTRVSNGQVQVCLPSDCP
jgi:3-phenylpropionate/trans-cinnamate dioxygenase ferredoxin subunit